MIFCTTYQYEYNPHLHLSSPTRTAQNFEDPLLDFGNNLTFGVETGDKVPEVTKSTEVNAKGAGTG